MAVTEDRLSQFRDRVVGRRISEDTYEAYQLWIRRYEMWRSGNPGLNDLIDFDSLLSDPARDYPWENGQGRPAPNEYAYRSRNQALSAIKLWIRLEYDEVIAEEVQNIVSGEPEPFDPPYVSRDDISYVIESAPDACDNPDCQPMLAVTYDTIMRAAEAVNIQRGDVDLSRGALRVRTVKGGEQATVGLNDRALKYLRWHIEDHDPQGPIFTNTYGNGWDKSSWASHVRRKHHEVGAHSLGRHSPILHRLEQPEAFGDVDETQDVFGQVYRRARHSHPQMTNRYARLVGVDAPDWAGE